MLALLRTIGHGWSQQSLAENARKIQDLGKEMLERLSRMVGLIGDVGNRLEQGAKAYNELVGALDRRVLVTARKMQELGLTTDKDLTSPAAIPDQVREISSGISLDTREIGAESDISESRD
jgi:DNA recombination protein RmuC